MYATISFAHNGNIYIDFSDSLSNAVAGLLKSGFWAVDENIMWFRSWASGNDITDAYVKRVGLCIADSL